MLYTFYYLLVAILNVSPEGCPTENNSPGKDDHAWSNIWTKYTNFSPNHFL